MGGTEGNADLGFPGIMESGFMVMVDGPRSVSRIGYLISILDLLRGSNTASRQKLRFL